jgi:hypothetical protein
MTDTEMADAQALAAKIRRRAIDLLTPLEREMRIMAWPQEYRAIMWEAVARIAMERAMAMERSD